MAGESSESNNRDIDGEVARKKQRKVGLVYDETMCKHDTPDGKDHPECPDRIRVIWEKLQHAGVTQRCVVLGSSKAEDKHLELVHTKGHVNVVKRISTKHKDLRRNRIASKLDSIYLNGGSSEAAYLSAGSVVEVAEKVAEGELDCGYAIVRPPGHHAEADEAMGFCLFNNVAVAASYLLNERLDLNVKKILIVDWDVHHGNGTQKMFWKDPRVLAAWDHILIPVVKEFNPDIILLSAGFDAAIGDPLGGCHVTPYGYSVMLKKLMEFAHGKIVLALEGGYNLDSIAKSSLACVQVLLEDKSIQGSSEAYPLDSTWRVIQAVRKRLCAYWPSLADESPWKLIDQKTPTPIVIISSSDSETEDDVHGMLDQMSKLNVENHQGLKSLNKNVTDGGDCREKRGEKKRKVITEIDGGDCEEQRRTKKEKVTYEYIKIAKEYIKVAKECIALQIKLNDLKTKILERSGELLNMGVHWFLLLPVLVQVDTFFLYITCDEV